MVPVKAESVSESDSESEEECTMTLPDRQDDDCMQPQDCFARVRVGKLVHSQTVLGKRVGNVQELFVYMFAYVNPIIRPMPTQSLVLNCIQAI